MRYINCLKMADFILFKNPNMKYRKEKFGGIIKTENGLYIIDHKTLDLLEIIDTTKTYKDVINNKESDKIIQKLIKLGAVLKISKKKANKIRNYWKF